METYAKLGRRAELDEVHENLAKATASEEVLKPLENTVAWVLLRARLDARSRRAKEARRAEKAAENDQLLPLPPLDPLALLRQQELAETLVRALGKLSEIDARIVWQHAEGLDDREIHDRLSAELPDEPTPSLASIRKRRQRARERLRETLLSLGVTTDDAS